MGKSPSELPEKPRKESTPSSAPGPTPDSKSNSILYSKLSPIWGNHRQAVIWTLVWSAIATVSFLAYLFAIGIPATQARLMAQIQ